MRTQFNSSKFNWSLVALLLLLLFSGPISACGLSAPTATPIADQTGKAVQDTESEIAKIAADIIDGDLGEISLVGNSVSDKKVIIFEERHNSRAGQLETAIMLVRLYNDYDMRYIALEGALETDGSLDASWYHQLSDSATLADVAVQMLKEGEISNAEFMALALPDVIVQGIEIAKEYKVELGEDTGSAPTLYLFYIALPSLSENDVAELNKLLEADRILEAVEFAISKDPWVQSRYETLTDSAAVVPIEDLIKVLEEIEAKADEVNAEIDADLKANLQDYRRFFEVASSRSDTMVDKTIALLDKHPEAPIGMIIGAAHTARISELLDNEGIAHVVIRQKALITEEPGELGRDAYERKLQALSVDEGEGLGALLDGRKKPPPVLQEEWFPPFAKARVFAIEFARAVAEGAELPFDKPPYDLQTRFGNDPDISINWDSFVIEEPEVIFSFEVNLGNSQKPKRIWVRAVQTDEPIGSETDTTLEQLLEDALDEVRNEKVRNDKTESETEEQAPRNSETPNITKIGHNVAAKFGESKQSVSKSISISYVQPGAKSSLKSEL